jgi:hypothetical protein
MDSKKTAPDLGALMKRVEECDNRFRWAEKEASTANNTRTDALNRLNQAQRDLDEAVESFRSEAPRESSWSGRHGARYVMPGETAGGPVVTRGGEG